VIDIMLMIVLNGIDSYSIGDVFYFDIVMMFVYTRLYVKGILCYIVLPCYCCGVLICFGA